jgi:8-oxo-dGTP pyrophosphatase MutT (NUDIX family)
MWIITKIGFFSVVQKPGTDFLTVRARVREDLNNLRDLYLPELAPTIEKGGTDYPWRATVSHSAFAAALGKIAADIDYSNFKNAVKAAQGHARAKIYGEVWGTLFDLPNSDPVAWVKALSLPWSASVAPGKKVAYGGVVFSPDGLVLLREPKNHFDGYVWTFPKGRPDPGESPQAAALRETLEESGVQARIVSPIPGDFAGGTTINRYFHMSAEAGTGGVLDDDPETSSIRWVSPDEARKLIAQTTNAKGRERDLSVLEAALELR